VISIINKEAYVRKSFYVKPLFGKEEKTRFREKRTRGEKNQEKGCQSIILR
jgi:hypothetical protein